MMKTRTVKIRGFQLKITDSIIPPTPCRYAKDTVRIFWARKGFAIANKAREPNRKESLSRFAGPEFQKGVAV
jgi:hypothetical protein